LLQLKRLEKLEHVDIKQIAHLRQLHNVEPAIPAFELRHDLLRFADLLGNFSLNKALPVTLNFGKRRDKPQIEGAGPMARSR
jgi:hypothetical protein